MKIIVNKQIMRKMNSNQIHLKSMNIIVKEKITTNKTNKLMSQITLWVSMIVVKRW